MTNILEKAYFDIPYGRAKGYLAESLADIAESGQEQVIRLRLPLLNMERQVLVRYAASVDPMHFDQPWKISWSPAENGPYPDFDGMLTVRASDDFTNCMLELEGVYTPPLGAVGQIFDAVAGKKIAEATAQSLLQAIGQGMLGRYHQEEAAKKTT